MWNGDNMCPLVWVLNRHYGKSFLYKYWFLRTLHVRSWRLLWGAQLRSGKMPWSSGRDCVPEGCGWRGATEGHIGSYSAFAKYCVQKALLPAGGRSSPPLAGVLSHSNSRKEGGTACFRALYLLLPTAALPRLDCAHGDQGQGCYLCSCPWWPGYPLYSSLR